AASESLVEGIKTLETALELAPENARLHLQRAAFGQEEGDAESALRHLDMALGLAPDLLEARIEKASYLSRLGRMDEAEALLTETLRRHTDDAEVNVLYAQLVEMRRADVGAAESRLRRAAARDPYLASAWRALASLLDRQGKTAEAQGVLEDGLAHIPQNAELHGDLGLLLARTDAPTTAFHLREAIRLGTHPRQDLQSTLASWLATHSEAGNADALPSTASEEGTLHARNRRAIEVFQQGDTEAAVSALEALVTEHPDYAPAWINLSWIALDREKFEDAARHANRAVELDPASSRAWSNLGRAREAQGRPAEAEPAYRSAVENQGNDWQTRLRLSLLLFKSGRETEATQELARVEELATSNPEARFRLATIYDDRGDGPRARLHYEAVVRLAPSHPLATAARERLRAAF
ncbi:MAG: tetratricopeptide repeat protein, partial [Acidobacteriota bacterium]|nr:tetratricopeptide repeat protein [Acidobacteriota bacterium]